MVVVYRSLLNCALGVFFWRKKVGVHPGVRVGHAHKVGVAGRNGSLEMSQREGSEVKGEAGASRVRAR